MVKSNQKINLSIIVACYNVYPYVLDCLKSLAKIKYPKNHLEILLIDDGSTDGTSDVTSEFAIHIPFMHVYHRSNHGVCDTRNFGINHAKGKYIAFVDGDDTVPQNAYSNLMFNAEHTHANIVAGFVKRFDNLRNVGSYLHKFAIQRNVNHTTIAKSPNLLYDTTVWNKVYLRSFLLKHHLYFDKSLLYEDLPFVLKAHLLSNNDSTITNVVYNWRWRDDSVTNSRTDLNNYKSRLHSLNICRQELLDAGYNEYSPLYIDFIKKVLQLDLNIFLENIGDNNENYIYEAQEITYKFLRDWTVNGHSLLISSLYKKLPIKTQILYYAIKSCNLPLLKKYTYIGKKQFSRFESHQFSKSYHYIVPLSKDVLKHINIHNNTLPVQQTLTGLSVSATDDIHCNISGMGVFRIRNMRMLKHPIINSNYHEKLSAKLVNLTTNKSMSIPIQRTKTPSYKRVLRPKTTWTNAHYLFKFNQAVAIHNIGYGVWRVKVIDCVKNNKNKDAKPFITSAWIGHPNHSRKSKIVTSDVKTDFTPSWTLEFYPIDYNRTQSLFVDAPTIRNGHLLLTCSHMSNNILPTLQIKDHIFMKGSFIRIPSITFICFNLNKWNYPITSRYYVLHLIDKSNYHSVHYVSKIKPVYLSTNKNSYTMAMLYTTPNENVRLAIEYEPMMLTSFKFNHSNYKFLLGLNCPYHFSTQDKKLNKKYGKVVILSTSRKHRYAWNFSKVSNYHNDSLSISLPIYDKTTQQLTILKGKYHLYLYLYVNDKMHQFSIKMNNLNPHLIMDNDKTIIKNNNLFAQYKTLEGTHNQFELKIKQHYTGWNSKKTLRSLNYSLLYPMMRWLPIDNNLVLFDSYWGHQFSSNERAIYHYIQKHYPNMHTAWILKNNQIYVDGTGERIQANSFKYWYYLARAKYIFQNTNMRNRYYKVPGQIETETLHGTFLKHMGFDEPHFKYGSQKRQDNFARRISRWDYMITPSAYMSKVASHAFDFHKKILPFGFPRNDELIHHNNHKDIVALKKKLHLPLNKKIILYAPTYRKHDNSFHLNLKKLQHEVGNNVFILIRLHYFVAHSHSFYQYPHFVKDVSDYPDINDLFLVSDALITDYSSVMFDYAYLERPIIFYPFDESLYLNPKIRGTYLNYDKTMPGPIVHTQESLAKQINNLTNIKKYYHNQIVSFSHKFAQYGRKGDATKHVVDYIFKHPIKLSHKQLKIAQNITPDVFGKKALHIFKIADLQSRLLRALGDSLPKRNIIMFDSFFGTSYSDNPKYLYLYIKKHYPKYKCYWNVNKEDVPYFKKHHIPYIVRFSYHGLLKQAQAKYWITNARRPFRWRLPHGAKMLMTWHGTPLKTLAADVKHVTMPSNNAKHYHKQVYNDNRRWTKLITPNLYSMHIMHRAFRMNNNQLIVTGYPRNDILVNHRHDYKLQNKIKQSLGIPLNKKVVLYAPTWRDNEFVRSNEFVAHLHLNLDKMKKHYGNNAVVLVRTHYMIANQLNLNKFGNFVINVSNYPDIDPLYLISDVLITDYSSVMFDYAILHRPIIFFDYDFDKYANNTRGFYFDIRKIAPGPIVTTTNQVIYQLDKIFNSNWKPDANYQKFVNTFDQFEDGNNCKRVVNQFLNDDNVVIKNTDSYPNHIYLKDGSLLWSRYLDLTNVQCFENGANYNAIKQHQKFTVYNCIQLYTKNWNVPLGHKFYLIYVNHEPVWCDSVDTVNVKD